MLVDVKLMECHQEPSHRQQPTDNKVGYINPKCMFLIYL